MAVSIGNTVVYITEIKTAVGIEPITFKSLDAPGGFSTYLSPHVCVFACLR